MTLLDIPVLGAAGGAGGYSDKVNAILQATAGSPLPWLVKSIDGGGTDDATNFATAVAAAAAVGGSVIIVGKLRIASNESVPSNVTLVFGLGGMLKPDSGITVTINSRFSAQERQQIFDLAAGGHIVAPLIEDWWARWFGAKGDDSNDDGPPISHALATAQGSGRNANTILGAGVFRYSLALTHGAANLGGAVLGVPWSALQQGSQNPVCILKWMGGASAQLTLDGFATVHGIAFQNWGTATNAVVDNTTAERAHGSYCSFVPPVGATAWSDAALKQVNFNYSKWSHCAFESAPAIHIVGLGTRADYEDCVIDCGVGTGPAVLVDAEADIVRFANLTYNAETACTTFWDNTASSRKISQLVIEGMEFDSNAVGAFGSVIKAKNIAMLSFLRNHVSGFGSLTAQFLMLTASRARIKGNTGSSINHALVHATDGTGSIVYVEENNLDPSNTGGVVETNTNVGSYLSFAVGADFAGVANIHAEQLQPGGTALIPVASGSAFQIAFAKLTDSSHQGYPTAGQHMTVVVWNNTAGALGTITWGAGFSLNSAFVAPAAGKRASVTFVFDGANWLELHRSA